MKKKRLYILIPLIIVLIIIGIVLFLVLTGYSKKHCSKGYELRADGCYKELDRKAAKEAFVCEDGTTLIEGTNKCKKEEIVDQTIRLICNEGYTLDKDQCIGKEVIDATVKYSCASGQTLSNGRYCIVKYIDNSQLGCNKGKYGYRWGVLGCYLTVKNEKDCPAGYTKIDKHDAGYTCTYDMVRACYDGEFDKNGDCWRHKETIKANVSYSCPNGYKLDNTKCYKEVSSPAYGKYDCDEGYTKTDDGKCSKNVETELITRLVCEEKYVLEEKECVLYDIKQNYFLPF